MANNPLTIFNRKLVFSLESNAVDAPPPSKIIKIPIHSGVFRPTPNNDDPSLITNNEKQGAPCSHQTTFTHHSPVKASLIIYFDNRAAAADLKTFNARRIKALHMAWDFPHRAHGPQEPAYRPLTHGWNNTTKPTPDWDDPRAHKPRFAQQEAKSRLLDEFNHQYDSTSVDIDPEDMDSLPITCKSSHDTRSTSGN